MFIQQSAQNSVGIIQNIPKEILNELVIGQRLEVVINKSTVAAEIVSIKVAGGLLELRTPIALRAGQTIQLEVVMENGKPVLKFVDAAQKPQQVDISSQSQLKQGQQLAIEVIKILADKRLLVQTVTANSSQPQNQLTANLKQFDIDVSRLTQQHQVGEKLLMTVVSSKPLNIQLSPQTPPPREQVISDKIRQLLAQQPASLRLDSVTNLVQKTQIPESLREAIQQLVRHSIDKSQLTQPESFKKAVVSSGVSLENQLLKQPNQSQQDFKANLGKILVTVEAGIKAIKGQSVDNIINKLPAQVPAALSVNGKTPAQLLSVLLSGYQPQLAPSIIPSSTLAKITSQEQATTLVQLLTKPLTLMHQNMSASNSPRGMNMEALMQLFKEVEAVHNKLQLNQLIMLKEPETSNTLASWLFDIPIKDKQSLDLVHMQIDQQKQEGESEDDEQIWNIKLNLDTQNLGPVQATVTLQKEDVSILIRAERRESAQLLEDNLSLLNEAMDRLGVSIKHSSCHCGAVDSMVTEKTKYASTVSSLLDVSV